MTKMMKSYKDEDVKGFISNSVRHIIIGMDEEGNIEIMVDNLPENLETPSDRLVDIGLIYQGLCFMSNNMYPKVEWNM